LDVANQRQRSSALRITGRDGIKQFIRAEFQTSAMKKGRGKYESHERTSSARI
jgi:hypothetical protein